MDQAQAQGRQTRGSGVYSANKAAKARAEQIVASRTQVKSGEDQVRAPKRSSTKPISTPATATSSPQYSATWRRKSVAVGNYVQPGTQLLAIVP